MATREPDPVMLKSIIMPALMGAIAVTAGCATATSKDVLSHIDPINQLATKTEVYCSAPSTIGSGNQGLAGRGAAGGLGPMEGLTLGGYVFNSMLMGLAPLVAMRDQAALEYQIQTVMEHESDGRELQWRAPSSGDTVNLKPSGTKSSFRVVTVPRSEEVGRTPDSFRVERGRYITKDTAALRPSPTISSDVSIDQVPPGRMLDVYGRVRGVYSEDWYMVGTDGRAIGYMEPRDLRPAAGETAPRFRRVTGPALRDRVSATVTCRTLTYDTVNGSRTVEACRTPEGRWLPKLDRGQRIEAACMPLNQTSFLK